MSIDAVLAAHLERTSLSPRATILAVLESNNLDAIVHEVKRDISESTPIVLAATIFTLLPKAKAEPAAVASCLVALAARLATCETCSYDEWRRLLDLLEKNPRPDQLADFLKMREEENDTPDDAFIIKTWSRLAKILQLEQSLVAKDIPLESWINGYFLPDDDPVLVILLIFYSCSERFGDFDYESLLEDAACQHFVLQAATKCENFDRAITIVKSITGDDLGTFIDTANHEAILLLYPFYFNQKFLSFDTVCRYLAKLNRKEDDAVINNLLSKEWILDPIAVAEERPPHLSRLERLLGAVPECAEKCLDLYLGRYQEFAEENKKQLKRYSKSTKNYGYRTTTSLRIKAELIQVLFYIYSLAKDNNGCFDKIKKVLMEVRFTIDSPEPKVFNIIENSSEKLVYEKEVITLPLK